MKKLQSQAKNKKELDSELDDELAKMSKECGVDLSDDEDGLDDFDKKSGNDGSDDELKALENELNDDDDDVEDDEDEKKKPPAKQAPAPKQAPAAKQPVKQPEPSSKEDKDIYTEETEGKYHNAKNIKCMSAIEEEKKMCETIINYKKKNKLEYDYWETKITILEQQESFITTCIENEKMSIEDYKGTVKKSLDLDKKLLAGIPGDKELKQCEIPELKKRLEKRIELMEAELSEEVEEEPEEETEPQEEEEEQQPKEEPQKVQKQQQQQQPKESSKPSSEQVVRQSSSSSSKPSEVNIQNDKLLGVLEARLQQYKSAFLYFQQNELTQQKDETNKNAKIIKAAIDAIKNGQGKNITLEDLPGKITAEYIWGYSREVRDKKFQEILNFYTNQYKTTAAEKDAFQKKTEEAMKSGKKIPKKQIDQIKETVKKQVDELASIKKTIDKMKLIMKDDWYPSPLFGNKKIKIKTEKTNSHIDENAVVIHVSELTFHQDNLFIEINCTFDNPKKDKIYPVKNHTFNSDVIWNLNPNEFKNFYRKKLEMKLFKKKFIGSTLITEFNVKLNPLSNKTSFKETVSLKIDKSKSHTVNIDVLVRNPCVEPEIVEQEISKPALIKIYPRFQLPEQPKPQSQSQSQAPTQQKQQPTAQKKPQAPAQQKPQTKVEDTIDVKSIQIDKSKLTPAELADPYDIDTLNCVGVLNLRLNQVVKQMEAIEGRTPKELRTLIVKLKTKKKHLEDALGDTITIEQYTTVLTNQINHDKMLYAHFIKEGMKDKADIVLGKIKIMIKELNEAESVET